MTCELESRADAVEEPLHFQRTGCNFRNHRTACEQESRVSAVEAPH
ncbi:transcription factor Zn, partial [Colletotrichum scovillei]